MPRGCGQQAAVGLRMPAGKQGRICGCSQRGRAEQGGGAPPPERPGRRSRFDSAAVSCTARVPSEGRRRGSVPWQ
eukprot:scaffold98188_cov34-Tisochrysis_lutea.AAC.2